MRECERLGLQIKDSPAGGQGECGGVNCQGMWDVATRSLLTWSGYLYRGVHLEEHPVSDADAKGNVPNDGTTRHETIRLWPGVTSSGCFLRMLLPKTVPCAAISASCMAIAKRPDFSCAKLPSQGVATDQQQRAKSPPILCPRCRGVE